MKLVHPLCREHFDFEGETVPVLVVENPQVYYAVCRELLCQTEGQEGRFVLSRENDIISIQKNIDFVQSYLPFEMNQRTLLSRLYKYLDAVAVSEEHYVATQRLRESIFSYTSTVLLDTDTPLEWDENFNLAELFKILKVRFESNSENLAEQILQYMMAAHEFLEKRIFVFVGLKSYLTQAELSALYDSALGHGLWMMLVESTERKKIPGEKVVLLDEDLCEIVY